MAVPTITTEERDAALAKAQESRKARAGFKQAVKRGERKAAEILSIEDGWARRTRVLDLLASMPGWGKATARKWMAAHGWPEGRRVGGLGARQRSLLLEEFGE